VPHVFENDGHECIELGFLKLFIMSQAVDLCHLAQESAFRNVEAAGPAQESAFENTRAPRPYVPTKTFDFFQTIVVPVVVRNTPRIAQGNAPVQSASNATTASGPPSYINPQPQPPQFKSMWNKTVKLTISHIFAVLISKSQLHTSSPIQNIKVKVKVDIRTPRSSLPLRQNTSSSGPAFLARLRATMRDLENMDQDLKAIETAQREGADELKELGQRVENIRLELTRQNAS
jgi:hypothetical protein